MPTADTAGPEVRWNPDEVRITAVTDLDSLWQRRSEWNLLVEHSITSTIFQTFEWHASWWKTLAGDAHLWVLLIEANGALVGIAPLMISERRRFGLKQRVLEFIGTGESDYCDFIFHRTHPETLAIILRWLKRNEKSWDIIILANIPNTSITPNYFTTVLRQNEYLVDLELSSSTPTRILGNQDDDQNLLKKKSIRRHLNFFQREGKLEFKNLITETEVLSCLESFFHQHIHRRSFTDHPSKFLDRRKQDFYRNLVLTLLPNKWLIFSVLFFNNDPIAFHFGFEYGKRIIWYTPSFDVAYSKQSPGEVLLKHLLEYAIERKLAEFDFTIGDEPYKYRYANHVRHNLVIYAYKSLGPYWANHFWMNATAWVKKHPSLARLGRDVRKRWRLKMISSSS